MVFYDIVAAKCLTEVKVTPLIVYHKKKEITLQYIKEHIIQVHDANYAVLFFIGVCNLGLLKTPRSPSHQYTGLEYAGSVSTCSRENKSRRT